MSKKKHRHKNQRNNDNTTNTNNNFNNPFGINPMQLLSLLGAADMNQLSSMLSAMGNNGFDLGGIGGMPNFENTYANQNSFVDKENNSSYSKNEENKSEDETINSKMSSYDEEDKENIEFLRSIRNIVDPNKAELLDRIIEKYIDGDFD